MISELLYAVQYVLGLDKAGNSLTVFPDDFFLVSFPKSGNTWTRFLLGNLIYPEGVDFENINQKVPDPAALSKKYLKRMPRPRYIKSHQPFDPRYRKVIYIVRDPRDVVLSGYYYGIKAGTIKEGFPLEDHTARLVAGNVTHELGTWGENVGSWMAARQNNTAFRSGRNFILMRYEDMIADTHRELARLALFLGIEPTPERIANAVERSSAHRMRELEKAQARLWSSTKNSDLNKPFVRSAKSGGWREELPKSCVAMIESAWGDLMRSLGYKLLDESTVETKPDAIRS